MAEPFTALIMAAGHGTRMRSAAAQGAASRVRQADGRVGHRRRPRGGRGRGRLRHAAGRGRGRGPARRRDRRRADRGRGHRRRGPGRARGGARRPAAGRALRRPPAGGRGGDRGPGRTPTREADAAVTVLTTESLDPAGYGRVDASRRTGPSTASSRPSTPRACPRRCWPPARSTSAPTSSSPKRCSARSSEVERAGRRALPHRRDHRLRRRASGWPPAAPPTPTSRRASTTART